MRPSCALAFAALGLALPGAAQGLPAQAAWTWNRDFWNTPMPLGAWLYDMEVFDFGQGSELFVCGDFWGAPTEAAWVARWSPHSGWIPLSGPPWVNDWVEEIAVYDNGSGPALYAGGAFTQPGMGLARWTPAGGWAGIAGTVGTCGLYGGSPGAQNVYAMLVHDDGTGPGLYIGGVFSSTCAPSPARNVVRYDGTGFHSLAGGVDDGSVLSLCSYDDGTGPALYVGGSFGVIGGAPFPGLARWDGSNWTLVGQVPCGPGNYVKSMAVFDDGSGPALYCSMFSISTEWLFLRWDGAQWTLVPAPGGALRLFAFDDGRGPALFCRSGWPSAAISRWDGHGWTGMGQGLLRTQGSTFNTGYIESMIAYDAGRGPELHVCGHFDSAGGGISARNVASWRNVSGPVDLVCPGDQTFLPCPCPGFGAPLHGCPNSFDASGGLLTASGATGDDSLAFLATNLPPNTIGVLFQGDQFLANGVLFSPPGTLPHFGDGLRCAGGRLRRLFTKSAVAGTIAAPEPGDASVRARAQLAGDPLAPGAERFYQLWYRDPNPAFCVGSATTNTTNGVRLIW